MEAVAQRSAAVAAPALVQPELDIVLRCVRDLFTADMDRMILDDQALYDRVARFVELLDPALMAKVAHGPITEIRRNAARDEGWQTIEDIRREYLTEKSCAPHCTVSCVHQVSIFDSWRAPQRPAPTATGNEAGEFVQIK